MSVYFIKPIGCAGPVKIGSSNDPRVRLTMLMAWSPVELEVIAEIEGDQNLEERIHAYLIDSFYRNEWFWPSAKLTALLDTIAGGSFDPDTLPESIGFIRHAAARSGKRSPGELEYCKLYAKAKAARIFFVDGLGWPDCPSIWRQRSSRRQAEMLDALRLRVSGLPA